MFAYNSFPNQDDLNIRIPNSPIISGVLSFVSVANKLVPVRKQGLNQITNQGRNVFKNQSKLTLPR